jgi:UDP-glucose 4-epimerase
VSKLYFITGATGFIGQHFLGSERHYCSCFKGVDIRVLSRQPHSKYETVVCDFQTELIPDNALDGVDTVFHLAGFAHDMRDASEIEDFYYKVNVSTTVQLANLAVKSGVKRFVFVSSVKAGGNPPLGTCANEKDQKNTEDVYGKTKREAELALLKIGKESGMHVSIIRPSLVYGPSVKGNLQLMLSGIKKGWFPPLPETGNRRSMIHVDDLVQAILLVSEDKRANGEIFIVTDGVPHSSREIYNAMCGVIGKTIPKWSVPKFLFDMAALLSPRIKYKINKLLGDECYSSEKLEKLGFKAQKTLKDMNETDF